MPTPHKHAKEIRAFADGFQIESASAGDSDAQWVDDANPYWNDEQYQFRVKPAAPKWPQTTMTDQEMWDINMHPIPFAKCGDAAPARKLANAALAHACETGLIVPASTVDKMMLQCHNREKELQDQIFKLTFPLIPSGDVKFSMPTPKPTVYVKSFKQGEIIGRDMQIAINVRAACYAKLPGQVSNEELKTLIDLAK